MLDFWRYVQLRLEKRGLEVGFAVLNNCTSPLPFVPFPTHRTQQHSTQNQPTQPNSTKPAQYSTTSSQHLTPQQHPHHRRLRRREPRSRTTLPPPPPASPLHRRTSTADHKHLHILNVALGNFHQHRPLPRPKHTTRHIQLTRPPRARRTRHRPPCTPSQRAYVRLAAQSSLGVVWRS